MLEAIALAKSYGAHTALHPLDLKIDRGEVYCLLGANGAGKTTTINLFLNFVAPTSGSARIAGLDVCTQSRESKKHVAYIPETVMLYRNLSGLENLEYFTALSGMEKHSKAQLRGLLQAAGLPRDAEDKLVGAYSKGMRQKVGIAIAMAKRAGALLLDEPTSGLDPKASNEFSELLKRMSGDGVAILMATHDLFRAKECGTRLGIMKHGRIAASLSAGDIGHADLERLYLHHMLD